MSEQQELAPKGPKKPKAKEPSWGEGRILAALRERFAPPAFAFFPHVRNQTGYGRTTRTADAIAMSLFPSRGLHLTGIEIKSDRGDWLREMRDPAKAEEIAAHCDFWVLAVGDRDIVQPGELPPAWGLLASNGKALKMVVEPKLLGDRDARIARTFLAAILRRAMEDSPAENAIKAAVQTARDEWQQERERSKGWELQRADERAKEAWGIIEKFEKDSGLDIRYEWRAGKIGDAVRALADCDLSGAINHLRANSRHLIEAADAIAALSILGATDVEPTP